MKKILVPSKGLEPPHPCGYMDLNHARLPIPPRWPGYDCGSFRHFGRSGTDLADHKARLQERTASPFCRGGAGCQTSDARRSVRISTHKGTREGSEFVPSSTLVPLVFMKFN